MHVRGCVWPVVVDWDVRSGHVGGHFDVTWWVCVIMPPRKGGRVSSPSVISLQSQAASSLMDKDNVYTSIYHALTLSVCLTAWFSVSNSSSVLLVHCACATRSCCRKDRCLITVRLIIRPASGLGFLSSPTSNRQMNLHPLSTVMSGLCLSPVLRIFA